MIIKYEDNGSSKNKGMKQGIYDAVCYSVIDMGTTEGKYGKKRQVLIGWKLLNEFYKDSTDMVRYSQFYTLSLNPKSNLRKLLQGWFASEEDQSNLDKQFDMRKLLNEPCKLVVSPNQYGKNLITQALPFQSEATIEDIEFFDLDEYEGGLLPEFISTGIQSLIKNSDEYQARQEGKPSFETIVEAEDEDDVPF
jgi:hypothetical protein|tara:strand:+ start:8552 stop:9133 length:582 start_codon:yes stop_codon:yes gene_type:complete